jgi:hypothetical protein
MAAATPTFDQTAELQTDEAADTPRQCRRSGTRSAGARYSNYLRLLIGKLDNWLRRFYGVREFSGDPQCILRVAINRAAHCTRLADGCVVPGGAAIIDLHLWNEHLQHLSFRSNGLGTASVLRHQIDAGLEELARFMATEPSLAEIAALRARTAFVPNSRLPKLLRVARSFGFEPSASGEAVSFAAQVHDFWENFFILALAWAFNPSVCRRNNVFRARCELWVSRDALFTRYRRLLGDEPTTDEKSLRPLASALNGMFQDHALSTLTRVPSTVPSGPTSI